MHDRNVHLKRKVCSWHFYWKVYWKIYATKRKWGQMAEKKKKKSQKGNRASLVVQWLRIILPMQGAQVQSLIWKSPTCCGATKPMWGYYWPVFYAHKPQLLSQSTAAPESHMLRACALQQRSHCHEKPTHHQDEEPPPTAAGETRPQQWRPSTAKHRINK